MTRRSFVPGNSPGLRTQWPCQASSPIDQDFIQFANEPVWMDALSRKYFLNNLALSALSFNLPCLWRGVQPINYTVKSPHSVQWMAEIFAVSEYIRNCHNKIIIARFQLKLVILSQNKWGFNTKSQILSEWLNCIPTLWTALWRSKYFFIRVLL
jgi:hypothetical protein